jgi:hypothetical protein
VNGEQFIIEVQRSKQENFKKRAIFYTSRLIMISEQAMKKDGLSVEAICKYTGPSKEEIEKL